MALEAFGFVWNPFEDDWRQGIAALEKFVRSHGHARVPRGFATKAGRELGGWCTRRRQERKHGNLAAERIKALDALGFIWDPLEDRWQQGLAALEEFVRSHGHARMPAKYVAEKGFRLGNWCDNRRQERKRGKLTAERIAALDALGFVWEPQRQSARLS
jgi:hypothetical protein